MSDSLHVVCQHCTAINRMPSARLQAAPKCGKCHAALFTGSPLELSADNFQRQISRNDIPVVIDFWAPWCGPCKVMAPAFEQAAGQLEPQVRLAKLNTENEQMLAGHYNIRSIPTLVVFRNGREVARQPGAMGAADIVRWVQGNI
ncbi:MAG: thioredoxin TrxC [Gammaproteobacteria bacterium]